MPEPTLSVVIPCFNEKEHIEKLVRKVLESPVENKELIVVDDFSTDGTREVLESAIRPLVGSIIYHGQNGGKGAALRTGFKAATGRVVIVQDADLEYDPMEYPQVIQPILDGEADVVLGSRFLANDNVGGYMANRAANKGLTALSNLFTGLRLTDMETCYKAFRRDIIQSIKIEEDRFGFEPEIVAKLAKRKARIKEVPISYYPRTVEEGKKIRLRDGLRALVCIVKYGGR